MSVLIPIPLAGPTLAIPTLDTIPGSASATPSISEDEQPVAGPSTPSYNSSRRPSLAPPIPGSYFPDSPYAASASGTTTPGDRPRPAPLAIPLHTPDEPLFSSYPDTGPTAAEKGKSKAFASPLSPAFVLRNPKARIASDDSSESLESVVPERPKGRRRASTISHPPAEPPPQPRRSIRLSVSPAKTFRVLRKRRASLGSPTPSWPAMPREEAKRQELQQPFSYRRPDESTYTLQSVSSLTTVRPLVSPNTEGPDISPRKSSLSAIPPTTLTALALSGAPDFILPDDMTMPHDPPQRRSSLSLDTTYDLKTLEDSVHTDVRSILSSSHATTETTASLEAFSPSSSAPHPLSSATTSLSRSAKSGQESDNQKDTALTAMRLQRSLEWEAKQTRHRRRLEKRKMILLELVETEVAYSEDLKTLVTVYLPQLHALPSVSERSANLVSRNAKDLLAFHAGLSERMVEVLREEELGYEAQAEEDLASKVERVSRRLSELLVQDVSSFSAYNEYCAGSIAAGTLVRHISIRTDYDAFERRCQIISSHQPHVTLKDLLDGTEATTASVKNRLHFRDYLIMPIQRVCRYPLMLGSLLGTATTPSPSAEHPSFDPEHFDVGVDVERALGAMRGVAEEADEARRKKEAEVKSATVSERMEIHPVITSAFLKGLGVCRLIGSLDVLHHHPIIAPLTPPVKVKYMAAFLYRGYLILAKVKKGKLYEPKHFLPLEVFELIDITQGFLPHSIRLTLREHSFDLAASCETEKELWAAALITARDESTIPPFELPASVSPFAARSRHMSATIPQNDISTVFATPKRHTVAVDAPVEITEVMEMTSSPTSVSFTPDRAAPTILLRRASATQRLLVDRGLLDVFSENCAQARSRAQLQTGLFAGSQDFRDKLSMRESSMLRRRRSFLDSRGSFDIAVSGEIKGLVIPTRVPSVRKARTRVVRAEESGTEADDTATSDFGTLRGREWTRTNSVVSTSPAISPRPSFHSLRQADTTPLSMNRRKTSSAYNLNHRPVVPPRAKSMPVSPVITPAESPTPLSQSVSENLDPSYFPSNHVSDFKVFPRGEGYTNTPTPVEERPSAWGTLKRNVSFYRSRPSTVTLDELAGAADPAETNGRPSSSVSRNESSTGLSEKFEDVVSERSESPAGSPGLKRRRSTRLLKTLSRFTPFEGIGA